MALVDAVDLPIVQEYRWWARSSLRTYYAYTHIDRRYVSMHRLILGPVQASHVDHVNGDGLDNRRENLRWATPAENGANRHAPPAGPSGIRGVRYRDGWWLAEYSGRQIGKFPTAEEAIRAYNAYTIALRGEFSRPHETPIEGKYLWICEEANLSRRETQVLLMNIEGGMAYDVIAERLGVSMDTIRSTMHHIRMKIRHRESIQPRPTVEAELRDCREQYVHLEERKKIW